MEVKNMKTNIVPIGNSNVIIAPMTTKSHPYPTRASIKIEGKSGWIVLDQLWATKDD